MERLLTPKEAGRLMAVTSRTVKEWLRRGELTGFKVRNMEASGKAILNGLSKKGLRRL